MSQVLKIDNLVKIYGKLKAVNQLSLEIEKGQVFGLLGPNGSGKTTTLGIILDVIQKTSGDYSWFGRSSNHNSRKSIGAILEVPAFYPYLSARRNLKIAAKIKECDASKIDQILDRVGLLDRGDDPYKAYSLGMKQRLAIGAALLSDPPVMILDEPTNGLDPQGIAEIRELILNIADQGKTILIASHILDEVQKVCTHFSVLRKGTSIYSGSVKEALNERKTIEVSSRDLRKLCSALKEYKDLLTIESSEDNFNISLNGNSTSHELNTYLIDKGIILTHLAVKKGNLEQKFLSILEEADDKII